MLESPIKRDVFDWGVQLTAKPFEGDPSLGGMAIFSQIGLPTARHGSNVQITFSAAIASTPLTLQDAQAWHNALSAVLHESRTVASEMKAAQPRRKK